MQHNYDQLRAALLGPLEPLTRNDCFLLWTINEQGIKIPLNAAGYACDAHDRVNWMSWHMALDRASVLGVGVAYDIAAVHNIVCIDVDHCRDESRPYGWSALAEGISAQFAGCAIEVSQSGTGLHYWMMGGASLPRGHRTRGSGIEVYSDKRFIALTGCVSPHGSAGWDASAQLPVLAAAHHLLQRTDEPGSTAAWRTSPVPEWAAPTDDAELLRLMLDEPAGIADPEVAFGGKQAVSNRDLWECNAVVLAARWPSDKGDAFDRSSADYSLALRLAKWTGRDCPRMERMMRMSGLVRTRWDEHWNGNTTRLQRDVMRAASNCRNVVCLSPVVAQAAGEAVSDAAFKRFRDEVMDAGDEITLKQVATNISATGDIDNTLRMSLAAHIHARSKVLLGNSSGWRLKHCEMLVALRGADTRRSRQIAENVALNYDDPEDLEAMRAPYMTIQQMCDNLVYVAKGKMVCITTDRTAVYKLDEFKERMAGCMTSLEDRAGNLKEIANVDVWTRAAERKTVDVRTFRAGHPIVTRDPNGERAINLWRPIERPADGLMDVGPVLEHIHYLFGADDMRFLDWLAHIEQSPDVLPHSGFLHIAEKFGTGRNWLASLLSRVWRGYVAPSVDMDAIVNGNYNDRLAGRVLAIVDEIRQGSREDAFELEGKIRNLVTREETEINPKYGTKYVEFNAIRWLLFSNHKNAIPLNDHDRRWHVVYHGKIPRAPHIYQYLYDMLANPAFVHSFGWWLRQRAIAHFNPGATPPRSDAKLAAINAGKSEFRRLADDIVNHWPADYIRSADIEEIMMGGVASDRKISVRGVKFALEDAGMESLPYPIRLDAQNTTRAWRVRQHGDDVKVRDELVKIERAFGFNAYRYLQQLTAV